MKKVIVLLFALLSFKSFSQISYSFENGTTDGWFMTQEGRWAADSYQALSGGYSLHHVYNNSSAGTDAASFSLESICPGCSSVTWSFYVRHGYAPSSSNKWAFVLSSDLPVGELSAATGFNGFAAGVNLTGNDDTLRLWNVTPRSVLPVISTKVNWEKDIGTSAAVRIEATRDVTGNWSLSVYKADGSVIGCWHGFNTGSPFAASAGIVYSYTATADQLLWLDNVTVTGTFVPDTAGPRLIAVNAVSLTKIRVTLDEETPNGTLPASGIHFSTPALPVNVVKVSGTVFDIQLSQPLVNKTRTTLYIDDLCDRAGNCSNTSFDFTPLFAEPGDVVISEIMFDPSPPVRLPDAEYIEIFNRCGYPFSTSGWMLIAGADTSFFPETFISAGETAILCKTADTSSFSSYGRTIGIKSFPGLNDSGEKIAIRRGDGKLIHALGYGPQLYNDELRSGGGWSAEMADTDSPFNTAKVWCASHDPSGGTPGKPNSVHFITADTECPKIITVYPEDAKSIILLFNETLFGAERDSEYSSAEIGVKEAKSVDITDTRFRVEFESRMDNSAVYQLLLPGSAADFAGNRPCHGNIKFGMPAEAGPGDLLFNELLFNPVSPCGDYAELYNNSSSLFDLAEYYFTSTDPESGKESKTSPVSSYPKLIFPGEVIAVTSSEEALSLFYPCAGAENIIENKAMPSMPDDKGIISLYSKSLKLIDRVSYSSSMHLLFISDDEGVSLEKVNPGLPSGVASNWHSASELCRWGTPGAPNSVTDSLAGDTGGVTLSGERVSPDGDGYQDVVSVDVFPGGEDNVVTVKIYNSGGQLVRTLCERFYAGTGASFIWDGTNGSMERVKRGLYLITISVYTPAGKTRLWKKVCAVLYD